MADTAGTPLSEAKAAGDAAFKSQDYDTALQQYEKALQCWEKEFESKESESKESEAKETESKETEAKETEAKEIESKSSNIASITADTLPSAPHKSSNIDSITADTLPAAPHVLHGNRSLCYNRLEKWTESYDEAEKCIRNAKDLLEAIVGGGGILNGGSKDLKGDGIRSVGGISGGSKALKELNTPEIITSIKKILFKGYVRSAESGLKIGEVKRSYDNLLGMPIRDEELEEAQRDTLLG
jgi:tetratricopeptide (TPR) repeat protein